MQSQHYIAPSVGYSLGFFNSDDLVLFKDSYNSFQRSYESGLLKGFSALNQPVGIRLELAYLYFGKIAGFANFGFQNFGAKDFAEFSNRTERKLELSQSSFFIEGGIGPRINQFFVAGIFTVYLSKKLSLESTDNVIYPPDQPNPLDGTYKTDKTISADIGMAFGVVKDPITLTFKITYPLFTGGKNSILVDDNLAKISAGTSVFPADLYEVLSTLDPESDDYGKSYQGIRSNIDGFKIIVTLSVPFRLKGSDDDW